MWHDSKAVTVSQVQRVSCRVVNGPIESGVITKYSGWHVGSKTYDLCSFLSISAGSRLSRVLASVTGDSVELCTGLAKHEGCNLIESGKSENPKWAYIGSYGKQSLSGDDLGIAVLYRSTDAIELTQDSASQIVVLRPVAGRIMYYFAAAWQGEPGGIKNESEFKRYLDDTILELSNPIRPSF
jgi:hypothetical protein